MATRKQPGLTPASNSPLLNDLATPAPAQEQAPEVVISKQRLSYARGVELVRLKREQGKQDIAYSSRPFVLCGLPVRRPPKDVLLHTRRNGDFLLEVTGHPSYGLPFGTDRLIPIWLSTLAVRQKSQEIRFATAAEMLDAFGLSHGGKEYRRLIAGFERVFGATVFFGTDTQTQKARVIHKARFNFLREAQLWYSRDPNQKFLPGEFENIVVLSDEFYREVLAHPVPADLEAIRSLAHAPAQLDLFLWLTWRCWTAKGKQAIPLFGDRGLEGQLGVSGYTRPRRFRENLERWLRVIHSLWPECPAIISDDGDFLLLDHAAAINPVAGGC